MGAQVLRLQSGWFGLVVEVGLRAWTEGLPLASEPAPGQSGASARLCLSAQPAFPFPSDLPAFLLPAADGGALWLRPVRPALAAERRVLQLQEEPQLE